MPEKMKSIIDNDAAKTDSAATPYAMARHDFRRFRPKNNKPKAMQAKRVVKTRDSIIGVYAIGE